MFKQIKITLIMINRISLLYAVHKKIIFLFNYIRKNENHFKNAGIFVTVSDNIKYADVAYRAYSRRMCIEETIATLKTRMQLKRLRVSSEDSLCGKCFIEFIALTLYSFLYQRLEAAKKAEAEIPHHSLSGIMDELSGIKDYYFSDTHEHVINPLSKKQKMCLDIFKVKYPKSYYDTELAEVNRRKQALKPHGDDLRKGM